LLKRLLQSICAIKLHPFSPPTSKNPSTLILQYPTLNPAAGQPFGKMQTPIQPLDSHLVKCKWLTSR